jgi:hypothetical protein
MYTVSRLPILLVLTAPLLFSGCVATTERVYVTDNTPTAYYSQPVEYYVQPAAPVIRPVVPIVRPRVVIGPRVGVRHVGRIR